MQEFMGHHSTMDIIKDFLFKINSKKVLVIAGNHREFDSFIEQVLSENDRTNKYEGYEFIYCENLDSVRGIRFDKYLYYGSGASREDIDPFILNILIKF